MTKSDKLKLLSEKVVKCEKCSILVENRNKVVFGRGDSNAKVVFIGEGPGSEEDKQGIPFVGRAGKLLSNIISACNFDSYYIMNVLKCRPPGNRDPLPEEAKNCRPFFDLQLKVIAPRFIVCLGKVAASNVLNYPATTPMYVYRNDAHQGFHKIKNPINAKVVVTWHPAYALRNPEAKKQIWEDLTTIMKQLNSN
jgi:uracil-DNA glycosylase